MAPMLYVFCIDMAITGKLVNITLTTVSVRLYLKGVDRIGVISDFISQSSSYLCH